MGGWVDGHFDILLKPPQPFTGLFLHLTSYLDCLGPLQGYFKSLPFPIKFSQTLVRVLCITKRNLVIFFCWMNVPSLNNSLL